MSTFRTVLRATAAAATLAAVETAATCPHGLTANDIAASSGLDLTGKVALVTGGRSGLGNAISEALLRQNCTVVIASRNVELNVEAVRKLKDAVPGGADVSYRIFDLEDFSTVRSFASQFISDYARLDYYFGNAGQGDFGAKPLTVDGYERIFQVNYVAQFLLLELLLPLLRQSGDPSRVMLTASSTHALACGSLGLSSDDVSGCFGDGSAIAKLPFDKEGVDAMGNEFQCPPLYSSYPVTKFLMTQLAREITKREAGAVNAYAWAPGNIHTNLNPYAACCVGPLDNPGEMCRYQLPYVGPTRDDGTPNPPDPPVPNHWTSPAHGAMAALYVALKADIADDSTGLFHATYWECEAEKGYFPQGITQDARAEIYNLSMAWAGISAADGNGFDTDSPAGEPTDAPTVDEASEKSTSGRVSAAGVAVLQAGLLAVITCIII